MNGADSEAPDWSRVKEIFAEASDLPPDGRAAHVHAAAAGDAAIEAECCGCCGSIRAPKNGSMACAAHRESCTRRRVARLFPGQVLAARYEIQQFLAVGGMGEVYRAHDLQLDQSIAIKVLSGELATADQLSLLKREVQAARRIQHANVCRVFDLVHTEMARGRSAAFSDHGAAAGRDAQPKAAPRGCLHRTPGAAADPPDGGGARRGPPGPAWSMEISRAPT
jgi:hypothetical protein